MITLGFYLKQFGSYGANVDKLAVYPWFSSKHNMGMAINRNTWSMIKNCSQVGFLLNDAPILFQLFCTYDDYNWDWSLMRVNMQCFKERLYVLYAKAPRVFHIGDCGVHHQECDLNSSSSASKVKEMLTHVVDRLFPPSMHVSDCGYNRLNDVYLGKREEQTNVETAERERRLGRCARSSIVYQ